MCLKFIANWKIIISADFFFCFELAKWFFYGLETFSKYYYNQELSLKFYRKFILKAQKSLCSINFPIILIPKNHKKRVKNIYQLRAKLKTRISKNKNKGNIVFTRKKKIFIKKKKKNARNSFEFLFVKDGEPLLLRILYNPNRPNFVQATSNPLLWASGKLKKKKRRKIQFHVSVARKREEKGRKQFAAEI